MGLKLRMPHTQALLSVRGGQGRARGRRVSFWAGARTHCLIAAFVLLLPGCEEATTAPPPGSWPELIEPVSPVLGSVGEPLPVGVRVLAENGSPLEGLGVRFEPSQGGGFASLPIGVTDDDGVAVTTWTLGAPVGEQTMEARVSGFDEISTVIQATAFAPPTSFSEVSTGEAGFTCGVEAQGRVFCWGDDEMGQLGIGGHGSRSTPAPVVADVPFSTVSVGWSHACALDLQGRAHCWGANPDGRLGVGTLEWAARPVPVAGGVRFSWISAGSSHSCGVTLDGEAHCWGDGADGRLGTGGVESHLEPQRVDAELTFTSVTAGLDFTCGIDMGGGAHCWGNGGPWLGNGDLVDREVPEAVLGGLEFGSLSAGDRHVCGVTVHDEAYCWGVSTGGRLGIGPAIGVEYFPRPVEGDLLFRTVSAGGESTCGVLVEGESYCWGSGADGRLGDGEDDPVHEAWEPAEVEGGIAFAGISVARGRDGARPPHVCGVGLEGKVFCWGAGDLGQLGDGASGAGHVAAAPVPLWRAEPKP